jgi:hypothetical protein
MRCINSEISPAGTFGEEKVFLPQPEFDSGQGRQIFVLNLQTKSGAHRTFYSVGTGGALPWSKWVGP